MGGREAEGERRWLRRKKERNEEMEKGPVAGNDDRQYSLRRLLLLTGRGSR